MAQRLLEGGADPNRIDEWGYDALAWVVVPVEEPEISSYGYEPTSAMDRACDICAHSHISLAGNRALVVYGSECGMNRAQTVQCRGLLDRTDGKQA